MRKLYLTVFMLFLTSVLLFISAFIYLDKENRRTYHYIINLEGHDIGTIRIDKFVTEDKLIYKSISTMPFYPVLTESKSRITLDRKYNLESYSKDNFSNGASETVYLENKGDVVSFVAIAQSEFACLNTIPIRRGTFVFEDDSPLTYLSIIENYDFRIGRSQGFNAITHFSTFLPPMKRFVTLTSIRDEYIKVDSKRIKTECLLLKTKNYPQGILWVSKSDRSIIALEIPSRGLKIMRTFSPRPLRANEYMLKSEEYVAKELNFKNKNVELAGTLTVPRKEGRHPLVVLIWGAGPQDRQYQGFFTAIADHLSKYGFCVFRFDKRGIGLSQGDFSSTTDSDEIEDLTAALEYLTSQKEIDSEKIIVLGHSKGAFYASELASRVNIIKAIILMAPLSSFDIDSRLFTRSGKWSGDYLKLVARSMLEIKDKLTSTKKNWISISGKRCFLKRMIGQLDEKPVDSIKKIMIPVLILQGKDDEAIPIESASILDKALEEAGNSNHTLVYFGYLGHFFGDRVNDGVHRIHYEIDPNVLETIKNWSDKTVVEKPQK